MQSGFPSSQAHPDQHLLGSDHGEPSLPCHVSKCINCSLIAYTMDGSALMQLLVAITALLAYTRTTCASRLLEASSAQTDAQHALHAGATFCSSSAHISASSSAQSSMHHDHRLTSSLLLRSSAVPSSGVSREQS